MRKEGVEKRVEALRRVLQEEGEQSREGQKSLNKDKPQQKKGCASFAAYEFLGGKKWPNQRAQGTGSYRGYRTLSKTGLKKRSKETS